MSWKCYMVEFWPEQPSIWREVRPENKPWSLVEWKIGPISESGMLQWHDLRAGAMWWEDECLAVKLPGGGDWNIDRGRLHFAGHPDVPKWTRTGDAPNVTASPSINHVGIYHGWLRDGVLTDDCEGRKFDATGERIP